MNTQKKFAYVKKKKILKWTKKKKILLIKKF
jgi:hypothetical protein